jgi:hypothetical protein
MNNDIEFPSLDSVYGYEYKLNDLFFNLSRKTDSSELSKTKELFSSLVSEYKNDDSKIDLLFKLVLYTRDIGKGKGEQLLSYMMLFEFYKIFPDKAYKLLELFVWKYGSWRDIPYLCDYISKTTSKNDSPFIIKAVNIMNDQLYKDMKKGEKDVISTAAKWVPREGSKFSWLFDLLMENWTRRYCPYIFYTATTPEKMIKARSKASANYRKVFTILSRRLNLVETKLCNHIEFYDIDPLMINKKTMSKQWNLSFDMEFNSDIIRQYYPPGTQKNYNSFSPRDLMMEKGKELEFSRRAGGGKGEPPVPPIIRDSHYSGKLSTINTRYSISWLVEISLKTPIGQMDRINKLWQNIIVNKNLGPCIPVIDISSSVEKTGNIYSIIGNALLITKHSSIRGIRILFLSNEPLWYKNDSMCNDYVSIIKDIFAFLPPFTNSDILSGFSFLTMNSKDMNSKDIDALFFVIMTDKGFSSKTHHEIESLFHNNKLGVPKMLYWNISNKYVEMDTGLFIREPFFISGIDSSNFDSLFHIVNANSCFSQLELIHLILSKYVII